jgi:hypothetical protein
MKLEEYFLELIFNNFQLAILQLKQPISFEDNIKLACLPNKAYSIIYPSTAKSNVTAYILGWVNNMLFFIFIFCY